MPTPSLVYFLVPTLCALGLVAGFLAYAAIKYGPIVVRIFEEKPLFLPLRVPPLKDDGEEVRFKAADGVELAGTYLQARTASRLGVLVFCHEYLSDRWSYRPYADQLRDLGFDLFTFDFRNHGASGTDPRYTPLQWVTDREVADLGGALAHLRSRPDRDPAGFGLFGISRGGATALVVAGDDPGVWGVISDGAFPTRGTMLAYILRWAEIYVKNMFIWQRMPLWVFAFVGWAGRQFAQRKLGCRLPDVEKAASRLSPRPWLMIHGGKDAYIGPEIARMLFAEAREPKELWIVPGAKHNRCRETQPEAYAERIAGFLARVAPRRPLPKEDRPKEDPKPVKRLSSSAVL